MQLMYAKNSHLQILKKSLYNCVFEENMLCYKQIFFEHIFVNNAVLQAEIQKTLLLSSKMKQEILKYFERLSPKQKETLFEWLQSEKVLLLNFLRSLKERPEVKLGEIQSLYLKQKRQKRILQEQKEEANNKQELDILLQSFSTL